MRFSEKHAAGSLKLLARTHCAVGKLLMGLIVMSIAFLSGLLGSGCTVHDLGSRGMVFFDVLHKRRRHSRVVEWLMEHDSI